jgi:hypothetical protein
MNEDRGQGSRFRVQGLIPRFRHISPLAGLASLLCLTLLASNVSATELQWRKAGPKHFKSTADSQPIAKANSFAKPQPRRDGAVRAVAFEDDGRAEFEGPSFGARQTAGEPLRSVVVESGDTSPADRAGRVRSAQLQTQPPSEPDNRYNQQITEPFGQPPAEMGTTESQSTEVDLNEQEEISLPAEQAPQQQPQPSAPPAATNRQPAAIQRQPRTFTPAPALNAPRPDPFVPGDDEPNAGLPNTEDVTLSDEGRNAQADCRDELARLKAHTLDQVDLSIAVSGRAGQDFPIECPIDEGDIYGGRCWNETTYMWKASAICHKPLYFEDEALERYGHSWGPYLDPIVSGAHFFSRLPVLPYCMGVTPPNECMYALGYYRPGNCAPYMIPPVPLSCRGAILEAGGVVGAAAILP